MPRYYDALLERRQKPKWEHLSWVTARALLAAINDLFARGSIALVQDTRSRWVAGQRAAGFASGKHSRPILVDGEIRTAGFFLRDPPPSAERGRISFFVLGDPGDADASQYSVVRPLLDNDQQLGKTAFMVFCSDIVYPAGDINDYINAFYVPYGDYDRPIFALPGNHDWYDGLNGFMFHFCGAEPLPVMKFEWSSYSLRELLFRLLWRRGAAPHRAEITAFRSYGGRAKAYATCPCQPGPYWALDLGPLLLVAIDTGVTGELDAEQGEWLRTVSKYAKDKVLITGKPLYVDQRRAPGDIETPDLKDRAGQRLFPDLAAAPKTVEEIVRDPAHRYRVVIGGDVHNYQRYAVEYENGTTEKLHAIVSGGAGAYLSNTHRVPFWPPPSPKPPRFDDIAALEKVYPDRADSLRLYVGRAHRTLWVMAVALVLMLLGGVATAIGLRFSEANSRAATTALWIEAAALGAGLAAVLVLSPRSLKKRDLFTEFVVLGAAPVLGSLMPLSAGWLIPGRFREACFVGGLILLWVALPTAIDRCVDGRPFWLSGLWFGVLASSLGGCLFVIQHWDHRGAGFQAAAGIAALAVVVVLLVLAPRVPVVVRHPWLAPLLPPALAVGLVYWYVFVSVDALFGQLTVVSLTVWLLGTIVLGSHLGQRLPGGAALFYTCMPVAGAVGIAYLVYVHDQRYPRLAAALLVASILVAAGAALLYLLWLRGMQNLCWASGLQGYPWFRRWHRGKSWRRRCEHLGMVPLPFPSFLVDRFGIQHVSDQAMGYLDARRRLVAWRMTPRRPGADDSAMLDVPEPVRRCFDTIKTRPSWQGTGDEAAKRSPLSHLISELFDPDEPPFYKNFLRCDLREDDAGAWVLTVRPYGVKGFDPPSADLIENPLHIALDQ